MQQLVWLTLWLECPLLGSIFITDFTSPSVKFPHPAIPWILVFSSAHQKCHEGGGRNDWFGKKQNKTVKPNRKLEKSEILLCIFLPFACLSFSGQDSSRETIFTLFLTQRNLMVLQILPDLDSICVFSVPSYFWEEEKIQRQALPCSVGLGLLEEGG